MCNECRKVKPLEEFHNKTSDPTGKQPKCKVCNSEWFKTYRKRKNSDRRVVDRQYDEPKMTSTTKTDWCLMYYTLQKLGYNIHEDIHQQFLDKHGLTKYNERPKKNKILWKPEDCLECFQKTNPFADEQLSHD